MKQFTCQVCGRAIKAASGVIAHHGYERPYEGWQTASCDGARYLPYEESSDRLREVVEMMKNFISSQEKAYAAFLETPPQSISVVENASSYRPGELVAYTKPETFDPKTYYGSIPRTYAFAYDRAKIKYEYTIKAAKADLSRMEKRLNAWKAPGAEQETEAATLEEVTSQPASQSAKQPRTPKPEKTVRNFLIWGIEWEGERGTGIPLTEKKCEEKKIEATSLYKAKEVYQEWYYQTYKTYPMEARGKEIKEVAPVTPAPAQRCYFCNGESSNLKPYHYRNTDCPACPDCMKKFAEGRDPFDVIVEEADKVQLTDEDMAALGIKKTAYMIYYAASVSCGEGCVRFDDYTDDAAIARFHKQKPNVKITAVTKITRSERENAS